MGFARAALVTEQYTLDAHFFNYSVIVSKTRSVKLFRHSWNKQIQKQCLFQEIGFQYVAFLLYSSVCIEKKNNVEKIFK